MTHPRRSRLLLALGTAILAVGTLEAVGRWAIPDPPPREDALVADPELGWVLPSGVSEMDWRGTAARMNALGLRGRKDPDQTSRILILGDSSVFGDGVRDHQTMADQLGQRLGEVVINGGVPGYTCQQSTTLMGRLRPRFQPEILVSYNMHSDFRRASPDDRVMAARRLGPLADAGLGKLISAGTLALRIWRQRPNLEAATYEACMLSLVRDHGGPAVLVIPFSESDFPESPHYGLEEPDPVGTRLVDYRAAMARVAEATGATLLDGPALIRASGLSQAEALQDMVHPTAKGHAVLAEAIAEAVRAAAP